jgi:hypothetical protein
VRPGALVVDGVVVAAVVAAVDMAVDAQSRNAVSRER